MAYVTKRGKSLRIQFRTADKVRRTLNLGRVPIKAARAVCTQIECLVEWQKGSPLGAGTLECTEHRR